MVDLKLRTNGLEQPCLVKLAIVAAIEEFSFQHLKHSQFLRMIEQVGAKTSIMLIIRGSADDDLPQIARLLNEVSSVLGSRTADSCTLIWQGWLSSAPSLEQPSQKYEHVIVKMFHGILLRLT